MTASASLKNKYIITSAGLMVAKAFAESRGVSWQDVATAAGIDPKLAERDQVRLSFTNFMAVFEATAKALGDDAAGVRMGAMVPIGAGKLYEYVCLSAPTLRTGLGNWARFHAIATNAASQTFEVAGDYGYLGWQIDDVFGPRTQLIGLVVAFAASRISFMSGEEDVGLVFELSHPEPRNVAAYEDVLGPNIRFNQTHDRIGVPARFLDLATRHSEPNLYDLILQSALRQLAERENSSDQVFRMVQHISEGLRDGELGLEPVARKMAMSPRTLQRFLKAEGTSFRELTDETRRAIALRYLEESDSPIKEIAFLAGFSEQSALSRAVRDWTGLPPGQYRSRARGAARSAYC